MEGLNLKEQLFYYYRFGVHTSDFLFREHNLMHRMMNIETGEWPEFSELLPQDITYRDIPIVKVWEHIGEMKKN